jgi:hypothetical protein
MMKEGKMERTTLTYRVSEIPDSLYSPYQMAAGGNVVDAAGVDFEHLSQTLANMPSGGPALEISFSFNPAFPSRDLQGGLSIYLKGHTKDKSEIESLKLLLERGPLSRFYNLQGTDREKPLLEGFGAARSILRRTQPVIPLHSPEFNDKIPSFYYTIRPFEPDNSNDYMKLDRVLSGIKEEVYVQLLFQPTDITHELSEHTAYLSRLQQINRVWDLEEDAGSELNNLLGNDASEWRPGREQVLKPMRYPDPLADDILREQRRFHETLRLPHFLFQITVLAKTPGVAQLIGSVVANSAFKDGSYRLISCDNGEELFNHLLRSVRDADILAPISHEKLFQRKRHSIYSGLDRLAHVGTVAELTGIFRLPVASLSSPRCIRMNTDPPNEIDEDIIVLGIDQEGSKPSRGIALSHVCKHVFISGLSGYAKTNSMINIIIQLHQLGIPFLVIESKKTDYRILKTFKSQKNVNARNLAETLEIYTPGDETISPFRINPLNVPTGISIDEHIDNLLGLFNASMPVSGPLPALLGEALERVYEDHPERENSPIMTDLIAAAEQVLEEKGYSPEVNSDIRAALEVRLGVLTRRTTGKVFQCKLSYPGLDHLMSVPAIIELDHLYLDQANILTLFLLMRIREYLKTAPRTEKPVRYVIILEEAQNILGSAGSAVASPDVADPKAFATEYVVNMLAEIRGYGVAITILTQIPSGVAPEVIKSTASKLAFCQVAEPDREELAATMLLNPSEFEDLARSKPGEAFFHTEGFHKARRIITPNLHNKFDFSALKYSHDILPYIRDDDWYRKTALSRIIDELSILREKIDAFDDERIRIIQGFKAALGDYQQVLDQKASDVKSRKLEHLKLKAQELWKNLLNAYKSFLRDSYRRYLNKDTAKRLNDTAAAEMRDNLADRFESVTEPSVTKTLQMMKDFINQCDTQKR